MFQSGFFISTVSNDSTTAMMLGMSIFVSLMITSGNLWPIEGMPDFLQSMVQFQPLTTATVGIKWIWLHGKNITFFLVWKGFLVSASWSLMFLISSVFHYWEYFLSYCIICHVKTQNIFWNIVELVNRYQFSQSYYTIE
uniref:ABC-2 type transporter transmembrane domain-containing protein n=1 Tax=Strigamia maritima TaxID=126957 RepID=T1J8L6_STRMM